MPTLRLAPPVAADELERLLEGTSNERLADAHAFYLHLGFERTSLRFAKTL